MTGAKKTSRPSMQDVAEHAGVSAQTVSRVLNGHPYVAEAKRSLVMDAVRTLGYTMNTTARALSSGRTRTIGVVAISSGSYAGAITRASIENAAHLRGYSVVSASILDPSSQVINTALQQLERQGAEGIILAVPLPNDVTYINEYARKRPTVTIGGSPVSTAHSLDVDQAEVARIATEHLLDLGHKTVWHVSGPNDWIDALDRISGWKEALRTAGRAIPQIVHGDWTPESGYAAGLMLGKNTNVTAVFVANDEMAFGLIKGLKERGRNVPNDVSVVSVDDIELAPYCSPALTTVAQPFNELSESAVHHLTAFLETGVWDQQRRHDLSPALRVRDSSAPAPLAPQ